MTDRRALLALGATALAGIGLWKSGVAEKLLEPAELALKPMPGLPGYRMLEGGEISFSADPFIGLETEKSAGLAYAELRIKDDFYPHLFKAPNGCQVPMAYFYDYQCPVCRRLSPRLRELAGVALSWHDLAGLGPASETAARASISARAQGAFDTFHNRLMRAAFQPNEGYIRLIADSAEVDADRLLIDMYSPATDHTLWLSRALADKFAMIGTPGLVIGRTVVIGNVDDKTLNRIVEMEQTGPDTCS